MKTIEERKEAIRKSLAQQVNALGKSDRFGYLYDRWQDEKAYEDFADYSKELAKLVKKPLTFVRATKSPFGFVARHPDFTKEVQFKMLKMSGDKLAVTYEVR